MTDNSIIYQDLNDIANESIPWHLFNNKTILISGANGFLPAYMVETILFLLNKGIIQNTKIIALVRNIEKAQARFSNYLNNRNLEFLVQDVCDTIKIVGEVDFIIHAASQASPKYYGVDPVGTLMANTLGTINLLKLAQEKSVESFLFFSSSEVYGALDESKIPTKENYFGYIDPTNVRSCYAESKRLGETACISWLHQYKIPVKIVRPFHTYGPGMSLDDGRVYADFISDIVSGHNIEMKSTGEAMRSFCYLSDATIAFFRVLLNGKNGEAYNVGNLDAEISILNLAKLLISLFPDRNISVLEVQNSDEAYLKSTISRNSPDLSKINRLGWFPKTNIKDGFYKTIISYEEFN